MASADHLICQILSKKAEMEHILREKRRALPGNSLPRLAEEKKTSDLTS
jgi:hypothetical protein